MAAVFCIFFLLVAHSMAATAVTATASTAGDFRIVTLAVVADGAGGAVSAEAVDLSFLYSNSNTHTGKSSWYLYFVYEVPGTGALEPGAHTVTLNCTKGKIIDWAGATTAAVNPDATDDLPNYWPVTESPTLDVDDIGAGNSTTIYLVFTR